MVTSMDGPFLTAKTQPIPAVTLEKIIPLHAFQAGRLPEGQIVLGDYCDENETRIVRVYFCAREAA
jgi:hypothetical protein